MKKKHLRMVWAVVIALVPTLLLGKDLVALMALPFTALGELLRSLSLSGGAGNAAAIGLFALACLAPLVLWLRSEKRGADLLLAALSPVLGWVLYLMVNPGLRPQLMQNSVGDAVYAGVVWSLIISWAVLRLLRSSDRILSGNIYRALRIFLMLLAAQLLVDGIGLEFLRFRDRLEAFRQANTFPWLHLEGTLFFLYLDFVTLMAERGSLVSILNKSVDLLEELEADPYSAATVSAGALVSRWCKNTLIAVTLMDLGLNLGQVLFAEGLQNISTTVRIPAASLAVCFGILALTRLLTEGKALKDDNDLFI